jgi:glycosyltransferase involved in cell wall biosynthesis
MGIEPIEIKISIIIPCYNSGSFLLEAIESCHRSIFQEFEVIVVNDGSSEPETLDILSQIETLDKVRVYHQSNRGASSARNFGVGKSRGEFLLFLDSDNKIRPDYLSRAFEVILRESQLAVVYSHPYFIGAVSNQEARFEVKPFNLDSLFAGNYIDMCSLVRKKTFLEVGGFDESHELFFGEDWDLWIRFALAGWEFHFIDEILFDYRIRQESLMGQVDEKKHQRTLLYLGKKHGPVIHQRYRQYFRVMDQIQKRPFSYFLRILYYRFILRKPFIK